VGGWRDRTGGTGAEDAERSGWGRGGCLSSGNRSALGGRWGAGAALRGVGANRPWSLGGMESAAAELPGRQAPAAPDPGRARTRVDAPPCLRMTPSSSLRSTSARCARFDSRRWERKGPRSGRSGSGLRSGRPWCRRRWDASTAAPPTAAESASVCPPRTATILALDALSRRLPQGRRRRRAYEAHEQHSGLTSAPSPPTSADSARARRLRGRRRRRADEASPSASLRPGHHRRAHPSRLPPRTGRESREARFEVCQFSFFSGGLTVHRQRGRGGPGPWRDARPSGSRATAGGRARPDRAEASPHPPKSRSVPRDAPPPRPPPPTSRPALAQPPARPHATTRPKANPDRSVHFRLRHRRPPLPAPPAPTLSLTHRRRTSPARR
jgi:hypothetical protein